jgi:hypothetical protein
MVCRKNNNFNQLEYMFTPKETWCKHIHHFIYNHYSRYTPIRKLFFEDYFKYMLEFFD